MKGSIWWNTFVTAVFDGGHMFFLNSSFSGLQVQPRHGQTTLNFLIWPVTLEKNI